jgi:hypothetical protein
MHTQKQLDEFPVQSNVCSLIRSRIAHSRGKKGSRSSRRRQVRRIHREEGGKELNNVAEYVVRFMLNRTCDWKARRQSRFLFRGNFVDRIGAGKTETFFFTCLGKGKRLHWFSKMVSAVGNQL